MSVIVNPDPQDTWERFRVPFWKRILAYFFLDATARDKIKKSVEQINAQRRRECRECFLASRPDPPPPIPLPLTKESQ